MAVTSAARDLRKCPGSVVHAHAKHVTSIAEAQRLFGVHHLTRLVNGRVIKCVDARKQNGKRANWEVQARYNLTPTCVKDAQLNIHSIIVGYGRGSSPICQESVTRKKLPGIFYA